MLDVLYTENLAHFLTSFWTLLTFGLLARQLATVVQLLVHVGPLGIVELAP